MTAPLRYTLVEVDGLRGIRCGHCQMTSFNPHDVAERYCGRCHLFLDDAVLRALWTRPRE